MADDQPKDVTGLLRAWRDGDESALHALTPIVYQELRRIASVYMRRERPDHTLNPTALVHEAYLRLVNQQDPAFSGRARFMQAAAHIMRQVLVDSARAHKADKRGAGLKEPLDEARHPAAQADSEVLDLHEALERLAAEDARKARVIELRYFGGLSREEIAEALDVSLGTVKRDLAIAEAWLGRELESPRNFGQ